MRQLNSPCKIMYICKTLASSYNFIGNGKFWPPFWPPIDPWGLENDVSIVNYSGYKAILKNNPEVYQKPLRNQPLQSYPKDSGSRPVYICSFSGRYFTAFGPEILWIRTLFRQRKTTEYVTLFSCARIMGKRVKMQIVFCATRDNLQDLR